MQHKKITQMATRHQLAQQISQQIAKSEMWLVLREDKEGLHLHTPSEEDLLLFAIFFYTNPKYYEMTKQMIEEIKKDNEN